MSGAEARGPLVSVIMGAFNCEGLLGASLDSMLAQDYRNIELVICDDGSSDSTFEVARDRAARDPRVAVLRNERNLGLPRTLNRCAAAAMGSYLARMDGDDLSRPDRLGKQVRFLEAHPEYDLCGSSIVLFDSRGAWGKIDYPERPDARSFLLRSPFAHPSVMFRASCLQAAGGYSEDPAVGRSEDYELFMRLYAEGRRGYNFQEYLLEYREDQVSVKRRKAKYAIAEARVRLRGFRRLGLLPGGFPYVIKPLVVGLVPKRAYSLARKLAFGAAPR
jgi:glycosyltransferase EpsE